MYNKPHIIDSQTSTNTVEKTNTVNLPVVTVVMTTHNRTNVACAVIDSLVKNLKYDGQIKWCISDDRSEKGHVGKLLNAFKQNGINDVHVERTTPTRHGLASSLNNALKYAWKNSSYVLTTEDDWILQREMDITEFVKELSNEDICCIRLAAVDQSTVEYYDKNYNMVTARGQNRSTFNLQVALRHKRIYDKIGYYNEKINMDKVERDMILRYNEYTCNGYVKMYTIYPNTLKLHTYDDPSLFFIHVGKSISGHTKWKVPTRYAYLYK